MAIRKVRSARNRIRNRLGHRNYHLVLGGYASFSAGVAFFMKPTIEKEFGKSFEKGRLRRAEIAEPVFKESVNPNDLRECHERLEESLNDPLDQSYLFTRWKQAPELNHLIKNYAETGAGKGFNSFVSEVKRDFKRLDYVERDFSSNGLQLGLWLSMGLALLTGLYHGRKALKKKR